MTHKKLHIVIVFVLITLLSFKINSQVPTAAFSINPNPVCTGSANMVQITDMSTGLPTSWSYTMQGTAPPPISTVQNPSVFYTAAGIFTITLIATNGSGASLPVSHTIQVLQSPQGIINPQNVTTCAGGNPVTLNVAVGPGNVTNTYSWSTGSTSSSITASPSVTTNYSCIITSTNGCSVLRTGTITIAQPTITIQSNPVSICPGSSVTMGATGTGPNPSTYSWSTGATTRTISTNVAGVYTVTVTDGNGCTGTQTYTLSSSPTLSLTTSSTPTTVCIGSNVTLHVTGGTTYTWSNGSNNANVVVTPTATTVYTVTGTSGTCTGISTLSVPVAINPTLSVSSSTGSICKGAVITLSATGADTYTWNPILVFTSTASASPSVSTTYTLRGVNVGCPAKNATISVNVLPTPVISLSTSSVIICAGENVALAASGASTFTWSTGSTNGVLLLSPTVTTTYSISGSGANGCVGLATITQSVSDCVGLNTIEGTDINFQIYPNPAMQYITITGASNSSIIIGNISGSTVRTVRLSSENIVSLGGLAPGIYFIRVGSSQKKLVILGE